MSLVNGNAPAVMADARSALSAGNSTGAIKLAKECLSQDRSNVEAWHILGAAYLQAQRMGEAAHSLRQCVRILPELAQPHFDLACAEWGLGNRAVAESELNTMLTLVPDHEAARAMLAQIRGETGAAPGDSPAASHPETADLPAAAPGSNTQYRAGTPAGGRTLFLPPAAEPIPERPAPKPRSDESRTTCEPRVSGSAGPSGDIKSGTGSRWNRVAGPAQDLPPLNAAELRQVCLAILLGGVFAMASGRWVVQLVYLGNVRTTAGLSPVLLLILAAASVLSGLGMAAGAAIYLERQSRGRRFLRRCGIAAVLLLLLRLTISMSGLIIH